MYNKLKLIVLCIFLLFTKYSLSAQNTRLSDHNTIGWFSLNGNFKLSPKWSITSEIHIRRSEFLKTPTVNLTRNAVNYQLTPAMQIRGGYAYIHNLPYGEHPLNSFGKSFSEHRVFEAVFITTKISRVELSQRWMLEQRWIDRYSNASLTKPDQHPFSNRFRYMVRLQMPIGHSNMDQPTPYIAAYDEAMVAFGNNVNENVFDQNRLGLLAGYKFSSFFRLEGGYFYHILQLGREVDGRNVFQYNKGIMVNAWFSLDWSSD